MKKIRGTISAAATMGILSLGLTLPATGTAGAAAVQQVTSSSGAAAPTIPREGMLHSMNYPNRCIRHAYFQGELSPCPTRSGEADDFRFRAVPVRGYSNLYRLAATNRNLPGYYLRHENFRIVLSKIPPASSDAYNLFLKDSAFFLRTGRNGQGISFESFNFPGWYIRHSNFHLYIAKEGNPKDRYFKGDASFDSFTVIDWGPELVPVNE